MLVEKYAFLPDTRRRGQVSRRLGIVRQYRVLAEEATVQCASDRHLHPCWGLFGGKPGALARSTINPGQRESEEVPSKFVRTMRRGDVFRGEMAASGGYGDPYTRGSPAAVLEDSAARRR